jgi:hypothetical protein
MNREQKKSVTEAVATPQAKRCYTLIVGLYVGNPAIFFSSE